MKNFCLIILKVIGVVYIFRRYKVVCGILNGNKYVVFGVVVIFYMLIRNYNLEYVYNYFI